jgi:hypothetical protein
MKMIPLSQDRFAVVDDDDFEWLSQFKWHYHMGSRNRHGYAIRNERLEPSKTRRIVKMHREILRHYGLLEPVTTEKKIFALPQTVRTNTTAESNGTTLPAFPAYIGIRELVSGTHGSC